MNKAIKIFKRFVFLGVFLLVLSATWKMIELRHRSKLLSVVSIKMLEMRLDLIEGMLERASQGIFVRKGGQVQGAQALGDILRVDSCLEQAAWVHGNGRDSAAYERRFEKVERVTLAGDLRKGPLALAHQKGQVVVSALEYGENQIPVFYVSYPIDHQEGGFVMARVNLWDFLKPPTSNIQDLLGSGFDFELRDREGNLLAHKTHQDSWSKMLGRFFVARTNMDNLEIEAQISPNKIVFMETFKSGQYVAAALILAAVLLSLL